MKTSKELLAIFSQNSRSICKEKGMAIGELEKRIGVSAGYLSRISASKKAVSLSTLYETAIVLNVSIDELLDEKLSIRRRIEELKRELEMLENENKRR